ncbi:MAG: YfcE family phosphodiesterase [Candidatus Amoebophilus sp. 36-38]|nr:MAG: YfcE family phosphodiesterase [Candidatus Amoebophilus sp. 36-38]
MKIGLISDTHGWLDPKILEYFNSCDEIWHAGDIGSLEVIQQLADFKPVRAVYGNIDGKEIRAIYPENQIFTCEGLDVWITHIGGRPPTYTPKILKYFKQRTPDIFVCGHSHILQVMHDKLHPPVLYLNPGAAGRYGFHQIRTLLRFEIQEAKISNMQAIELGPRSYPVINN